MAAGYKHPILMKEEVGGREREQAAVNLRSQDRLSDFSPGRLCLFDRLSECAADTDSTWPGSEENCPKACDKTHLEI